MCSAKVESRGNPLPNVWRLSASLESVSRNGVDFVLVTSLERAVRAWADLDPERRASVRLTIDRTIMIDGVETITLTGVEIDLLAARLSFD